MKTLQPLYYLRFFCRKASVAEFSLKKYNFPQRGYKMYSKPCFLIRTSLPPSEKLYKLTYQMIDEDYEGVIKTLFLKVIAPEKSLPEHQTLKRPADFSVILSRLNFWQIPITTGLKWKSWLDGLWTTIRLKR